MNKVKMILWGVLAALLFFFLGYGFYTIGGVGDVQGKFRVVSNFEECVAAGNPVMESYPRQCIDSEGDRTFVEEV